MRNKNIYKLDRHYMKIDEAHKMSFGVEKIMSLLE